MMFITAIKRCYDFYQKYGVKKAFKLFFFLYYGKLKQQNIQLDKERMVNTKTGCKLFVVPNDTGISLELSIYGIHEPVISRIIFEKLKKGMICVDIGANLGYFATLEGQKVGPSGKVIAIEPSFAAFHYLQKNLKLQNQNNYEIHNCACYDEDSNANFLIHEKSNISKIIKKNDSIPFGMKKILIPVRKLDSILSTNNQKIDFLRMDIEGYELMVLKGARNIIKKFKPMIKFELHSKMLGNEDTEKLFDFIRDENYKISYFLIRELDMPLIGTIDDSKTEYTIDDLSHMLETNTLPPFVQLFLEHKC